MATKKNTQHWEEIKSQYTKCLCYSEGEGLCIKRISDGESSEELLYMPQGYVGFVNDKIMIPGQDMEIEIQSNFGYKSASYLRATFKKEGQFILDFDLSKLSVLNNCSIKTFDVPLYDWNSLFSKLVCAYKESSIEAYTTSSIAYLGGLCEMLDKSEVVIRGNLEETYSTKWDGDFLVELYVGNKIRDLLNGFKSANTSDPVVIEHTLNLCRKYIGKVKSLVLDYSDSRVSQISDTLMLIHHFMCENKTGIEYLNLLLGKEILVLVR